VLWHAVDNVLHHLPPPPRSYYMLSRIRTRIEPPKPRPATPKWRRPEAPEVLIPVEAVPFHDVCQAHTLWARHVGHWSRTTFDVRKLARQLGKKPWYRPWNCPA